MTAQEQTATELARLDLRRSELEMLLATLPRHTPGCYVAEREWAEEELRQLWARRQELVVFTQGKNCPA